MATYNVTIFRSMGEVNTISWSGEGGTSSGTAFELFPGDIVNFRQTGTGTSVTMSSFASGFWTNSSNITLTSSNQSKTVDSGTVGDIDNILAAAGSLSIIRYFKMGGLLPDLVIDDIPDLIRPNGSTDHSITIGGATATTTYEVRTSSSSGTVVATANASTPNGSLTVSNMPSSGASRTYYVTGRRSVANGGSNTVSLILSYMVTHESPGSSIGDGGTGSYGMQVFAANGDTVLDVSDRVVIFSDHVTGTLTTSELTKNVTLDRAGTCVIDMSPLTVVIINGRAQRQDILHTSLSGTTLTITRTSVYPGGDSSQPAETTNYNFLVVYDPVST
jgi:hypothetical protein|tara:strand:+ start:39 stop:1034 length:996 start_codon:yes stop_codon:yes gene_type:complete